MEELIRLVRNEKKEENRTKGGASNWDKQLRVCLGARTGQWGGRDYQPDRLSFGHPQGGEQ